MKNNKKIEKCFATLIGYIEVVKELDSYSDVKIEYDSILQKLIMWAKKYYINGNTNTMNYEETHKIYEMLEEISDNKIFDKNIGIESEFADIIKAWYEELMKNINNK